MVSVEKARQGRLRGLRWLLRRIRTGSRAGAAPSCVGSDRWLGQVDIGLELKSLEEKGGRVCSGLASFHMKGGLGGHLPGVHKAPPSPTSKTQNEESTLTAWTTSLVIPQAITG